MRALPDLPLAHAVVQGMDELFAGALHPLLTPAHLLVLTGLGLLLGQGERGRLMRAVGIFSLAAAAGLAAACNRDGAGVPPPTLIGLGLAIGALVSLALPWPEWVRWSAAAAAGLALGWDSAPDAGTGGLALVKMALGAWLSLTLAVLNVAHYSARLPAYRWVQTGVRVVGSWIVAIGILMLAFALRR